MDFGIFAHDKYPAECENYICWPMAVMTERDACNDNFLSKLIVILGCVRPFRCPNQKVCRVRVIRWQEWPTHRPNNKLHKTFCWFIFFSCLFLSCRCVSASAHYCFMRLSYHRSTILCMIAWKNIAGGCVTATHTHQRQGRTAFFFVLTFFVHSRFIFTLFVHCVSFLIRTTTFHSSQFTSSDKCMSHGIYAC